MDRDVAAHLEPDGSIDSHEMRFDPLSGEWVLLVPHRQGRPNLPAAECPFCVGGLEAPDPYEVRWFENRFPPLRPGPPIELPDGGAGATAVTSARQSGEAHADATMSTGAAATAVTGARQSGEAHADATMSTGAAATAVTGARQSGEAHADATMSTAPPRGASEVVLFSPDHDASLATIGIEGVMRVIDLWIERTEALLARPENEYVLVFENRGAAVGATIHHPHGQIYGYPFVPPAPAREMSGTAGDDCPVCAELMSETADARRIVYDDGEWMAWVPFAASSSYGVRIAPRLHVGRLCDLDESGRRSLAATLTDVLARYERLWTHSPDDGPFPYLLWFHQAPAHHDGEYHLHAHVSPPLRAPGVLRHVASGELGGGLLANPVMPERAAADLRAAGDRAGPAARATPAQ